MDIERLPGLARLWEPKVSYVPPANWVRWPSLLCMAGKWHGKRDTMFLSCWDDRDTMLRQSWEWFDQADIVVGYNSARFDVKHLKSEWLTAGMTLPSPWKDVDLFTEVRRALGFESKSLDQVCKRLGLKGKSGAYSMDDAEAATNGDPAAQKRMRAYNIADVRITEQAYDRLRGWLPGHPQMGDGKDQETLACNQCGSTDLARNGTYLAQQIRYVRYRCQNCGANIRGTAWSRVAASHGIR